MPQDVPTPPATRAEFDDRLHAMSEHLPKRLRQCADYVAAHLDRIAVSTVADLASGAGVAPSAIMRFAQAMGFPGYSDLQRLFRNDRAQPWPDYESRLARLRETGEGSAPALLAEFMEAGRVSLEGLAKTTGTAMLDRAARAMAGAGMVHLMGLRRAFPVASYLAYALDKMGIAAMLHDSVGSLSSRHALRSGDVAVAISFNPYSAETVAFAEAAHAKGLPVVAITDAGLSPLRRLDPILIAVSEADYGAFRGLAATMTVATALAVAAGAARQME
jgi:DNA-binding MurR/RpiR family transcriptional regulator